jgi:hypothetical protein
MFRFLRGEFGWMWEVRGAQPVIQNFQRGEPATIGRIGPKMSQI